MIERGAVGAISVLANAFPERFSEISNLGLADKKDSAKQVTESFKDINPLMYEESNPVGVKEVLRLKGVCGNMVRLPLVPASESLSNRISNLI